MQKDKNTSTNQESIEKVAYLLNGSCGSDRRCRMMVPRSMTILELGRVTGSSMMWSKMGSCTLHTSNWARSCAQCEHDS